MQISEDEQSYHTCFSQVQEETSILAQRTPDDQETKVEPLKPIKPFRSLSLFITIPHIETIHADARDWGTLRLKKYLRDFSISINR